LAVYFVTKQTVRGRYVASTKSTVGEFPEAISTLVTKLSAKPVLTGTLKVAIAYISHAKWYSILIKFSSRGMAVTRLASIVKIIESKSTGGTIGISSEVLLTLTNSCRSFTIAGIPRVIGAVARNTRIGGVWKNARGSVVSIYAGVAVNPSGVVLTLLTNSSADHVAVEVHGHVVLIHRGVVVTLSAVAVAVAGFAFERIALGVLPPFLLREAVLAAVAHVAVSPVAADTGQAERVVPVCGAHEGVTVANTSSSHLDLFDGVVVSPGYGFVPLSHGHEMPQHSFCVHQPESDVGRPEPLHHHVALLDLLLAGSPGGQSHEHLSAFEGRSFGEFRGADDAVVLTDGNVGVDSEVFLALGVVTGEELPRRVGLAVVDGLLEGPDSGTGGVSHGDHDVGDLELLDEVDVQVDPVVLAAPGDGRGLPVSVDVAIHGIAGRVGLRKVNRTVAFFVRETLVTNLSINDIEIPGIHVESVKSNKFTVDFLLDVAPLPAGRVSSGGSILRDVKVWRGQNSQSLLC